jgi:membrane protein YdbS with pleckstrin-like domain
MTAPALIEVPLQRRRLFVMLAVNLVCLAVAVAAAVGVFAYHAMGLIWVFVAALLVGFAAHIWLMLGLARGAGSKRSV